MSRRDETKGGSSNPAVKWLEWKSDSKCFKYWDKDASEEKEVKLPLKFVFLKQMHTVKGWDGQTDSRIFANEIVTMKEELTVKSFKGGNLVSGFWKDIKSKVNDIGGNYFRSIYVLVDGEIWNIQLKGSGVKAWYDFFAENRKDIANKQVIVSGFSSEKNGAVKYTVPQFKLDDADITGDLDEKAEQVYATLKMYVDAYKDGESLKEPVTTTATETDDDDLPF